jgi:hypothetical protein
MSFLQTDPREIRAPETLVLPDGRKRLTRFFRLAHKGIIPPELDYAWGTADPFANAPTGWTGLRLTGRQLDDQARLTGVAKGEDSLPILQLIFEQIDASAETAVGGTEIGKLEDGRETKVLNYVQFSTGTFTPGTIGTDTAPGDTSAFLFKVEAPDDGTVRRITRTYVYAGQLAQQDDIEDGGALLVRTLVYAKTEPPTPSGYYLIRKEVKNPNGFPVYTYLFRKIVATSSAPLVLAKTVPFTYPGRAKIYNFPTGSGLTYIAYDVFLSPPVEAKIAGALTISYQTSSDIGDVGTRWQPLDWATVRAYWTSSGGQWLSQLEALRGYRSVSATAVEFSSAVAFPASIFGKAAAVMVGVGLYIYAICQGGPEAPDGNTYTLDADLELAFAAADGTKVYRKSVLSATIPAQPALPTGI